MSKRTILFLILGMLLALALLTGYGNEPPMAKFITPKSGAYFVIDEEIIFQGKGVDPEGEPVRYKWDFGDGATCPPDCGSGPEQAPLHTYAEEGEYTVNLIAIDGKGNSTTKSITIMVLSHHPFKELMGELCRLTGQHLPMGPDFEHSKFIEDLQKGIDAAEETLEDTIEDFIEKWRDVLGVTSDMEFDAVVDEIYREFVNHLAYDVDEYVEVLIVPEIDGHVSPRIKKRIKEETAYWRSCDLGGYANYMQGKYPSIFGMLGDVQPTEGTEHLLPAVQVAILQRSVLAEPLNAAQKKELLKIVVDNGGIYRYLTESEFNSVIKALKGEGIAVKAGYQYKSKGDEGDDSYIPWTKTYNKAMTTGMGKEIDLQNLIEAYKNVDIRKKNSDQIADLVSILTFDASR